MSIKELITKMNKKVSILATVIVCVLVFAASYAIPKFSKRKAVQTADTANLAQANAPAFVDQIRLKRYEYIQPLLMSNLVSESKNMQGLRTSIESYISELKSSQKVEDISVY